MINLDLKELKLIREALDSVYLTADSETVKSAIQKIEAILEKEGYKWERKAFYNEWKKINK